MADDSLAFSPGDLVRARGREWIVLPGADPDVMRLRPLSGSEEDVQKLAPRLEFEPVVSANFAPPDGATFGPSEAALLLKDSLRLSLRRGAGSLPWHWAHRFRAAGLSARASVDGAKARCGPSTDCR